MQIREARICGGTSREVVVGGHEALSKSEGFLGHSPRLMYPIFAGDDVKRKAVYWKSKNADMVLIEFTKDLPEAAVAEKIAVFVAVWDKAAFCIGVPNTEMLACALASCGDLKPLINAISYDRLDALTVAEEYGCPVIVQGNSIGELRRLVQKAIIPGPATFLSVVRCDNLKSALEALTEVLIKEVKAMERKGVAFIQINEPILSKIYPVPRPFIRAINKIANSVRVPTILHVCGDLSSFAHYIPGIDVAMISLELAGLPKNFDLLTPDLFKGKKVVLGCISTKPEVENREDIRKVVERGVELFPGDIVLSSDCGFAKTPREIVIRKMDNMVVVAKNSSL